AGRAVPRVGQGRAVCPGPTARAARGRARPRARAARRADARRRDACPARLSALAGRARPRRRAAHRRAPGRDARHRGPRAGGGQRVAPAEGRRLEAELNRDYRRPRAPAAPGFVQPAIYAPELELLFQVFPADRRLGALARAADGRAVATALEAALAVRTGGARLASVAVHVVR